MAKNIKVELPEGAQVTADDNKHVLALASASPDTLLMLAQAGYKSLIATSSGNAGKDTLSKSTEAQRQALAEKIGYQGDHNDSEALSKAAVPALRALRAAAIAAGETSFTSERSSGQTVDGIMRHLAKTMVENAYKAQYGALPKAPAKGKTHPDILALVNQCLELHKVALRRQAEGQLALLASMAPTKAAA